MRPFDTVTEREDSCRERTSGNVAIGVREFVRSRRPDILRVAARHGACDMRVFLPFGCIGWPLQGLVAMTARLLPWTRPDMRKDEPQKNQSEILFEAYLATHGYADWEYEPEIPGQSKHPDYRLPWHGEDLLFEVKELREKAPRPEGAVPFDPYKGLRSEIDEARRKFRQLKRYCCSLVVHNVDDWQARLDPHRVFAAMLGDLGFTVGFDPTIGVLVPGTECPAFLGRGKMLRPASRRVQNTTISSIIILEQFLVRDARFLRAHRDWAARREEAEGRKLTRDEKALAYIRMTQPSRPQLREVPRVQVIENPFARKPLPRNLFTGPFDERWVLDGSPKRVFAGNLLMEIEEADRDKN